MLDKSPALPGEGKTAPLLLIELFNKNVGPSPHQHKFLVRERDANTSASFVCSTCHRRITLSYIPSPFHEIEHITHELSHNVACPSGPVHHLHTSTTSNIETIATCCACNFTITAAYTEPAISKHVLKSLRSFKSPLPKLVACIDTLYILIKNVIAGNRQSINTANPRFHDLVGLDEPCVQILQLAGFTLEDGYFVPPTTEYIQEGNPSRLLEELEVEMREMRKENPDLVQPRNVVDSWNDSTYEMLVLMGSADFPQRRRIERHEYGDHLRLQQDQDVIVLGCVNIMADRVFEWAYELLKSENCQKIPEYIDSLESISSVRCSGRLKKRVQREKENSVLGRREISGAYAALSINDFDMSDDSIVAVFIVHLQDCPTREQHLRNQLRIIGVSRKSNIISKFLETGVNPVEQFSGTNEVGDSIMMDYYMQLPVGLSNIGNTCFLNSLLQYYFTITPLRMAILGLSSDKLEDDEAENEPDRHVKTLSGLKIYSKDIVYAKNFISLLKTLFTNLIYTLDKAIAPDLELARFSLSNARDELPAIAAKTTGISGEIDADLNAAEDTIAVDHKETELQSAAGSPTRQKQDAKIDIGMVFGKQQDVTECMSNMMYLFEVALRQTAVVVAPSSDDESPTSSTAAQQIIMTDVIKRLFYGKTKQYLTSTSGTSPLSANDSASNRREKEEGFTHLIVQAAEEGQDLYSGLDAYFDASTVEITGTETTRELTITELPPVLQIQIQRVQFDRSTSAVYKSNSYMRFDKKVYADRYMDYNWDRLKDRRKRALVLKSECDRLRKRVKSYMENKDYPMAAPEMLKTTLQYLSSSGKSLCDGLEEASKVIEDVMGMVQKEIKDGNERIDSLVKELEGLYSDLTEQEYQMHAVFVHQGAANYGHYFIYIYDHEQGRWFKYNDSNVSEVSESEVFADTSGQAENSPTPYFVVYVRATDAKEIVNTFARVPAIDPGVLSIPNDIGNIP